jgi:Fe2+ transport system protein FeoA
MKMNDAQGLISFSELRKGMRARVKFIPASAANQRLREMGLNEGIEFSVAKVAPFGDTIEIRLLGYALCLRKGDAADIQVEPLAA